MSKAMALVTGGASGMGLATVAKLARDGFRVVMVDRAADLAGREQQRLQALGLEVEAQVLDLTDEQAVRALIRALPPITARISSLSLVAVLR